jgi:hypothetical protein
MDLDEINDKIKHTIGSIKEIRIDNILCSKTKWNGLKWEEVCRKKDCNKQLGGSIANGLCEKHFKEQVRNNIIGDIVKRGSFRYKWCGNPPKWKMLCVVESCSKFSVNNKENRCTEHYNLFQSGITTNHASLSSIYNDIKTSILVDKIKSRKNKKSTEKAFEKGIEKELPKENSCKDDSSDSDSFSSQRSSFSSQRSSFSSQRSSSKNDPKTKITSREQLLAMTMNNSDSESD